MPEQLENFAKSVSATFVPGIALATPTSWMEAFDSLTQLISVPITSKKPSSSWMSFPGWRRARPAC